MKRIRALSFFCISIFIYFVGTHAAESELFIKGLQYYQRNEFQLAAAHFKEAKKADPGNPTIYFYLGNAYYQLNDLDAAILNYTEGLNFTDKKGMFFFNLGNCYFLKGNYEFSADMYAQAIANDPTLYDSYLNAGNAYYRKGNYADTIIQWETYLQNYPETPQYDNIQKAIAYLKEELERPLVSQQRQEETQNHLLIEVMGDLESLLNKTKNVLEISEKPIDDLTIQEIER